MELLLCTCTTSLSPTSPWRSVFRKAWKEVCSSDVFSPAGSDTATGFKVAPVAFPDAGPNISLGQQPVLYVPVALVTGCPWVLTTPVGCTAKPTAPQSASSPLTSPALRCCWCAGSPDSLPLHCSPGSFSTGLDGRSHTDLLLLRPGAGVLDCSGELQHFPQQRLQVCWVFFPVSCVTVSAHG